MAGPPVLIYLMLAGTASQTIRATLLAFFALVYAATLAANAATIGIPTQSWVAAGVLLPFAIVGGLVGRPLGDRLGAEGFALLAIGLLAAAGLLTLALATGLAGGVTLTRSMPDHFSPEAATSDSDAEARRRVIIVVRALVDRKDLVDLQGWRASGQKYCGPLHC